MRCPSCGYENPEGMNFYGRCRTKLSNLCPQCSFNNPQGFAFFGKCGAPLTSQAPTLHAIQTDRQITKPEDKNLLVGPPSTDYKTSQAERRQLTVMFCDLVGSTALSQQLDPEEFREVVRAYQEVCTEMIHRFEGHIAQYLGDGLLVYFGYPLAHEDDAQRAVRVGLGIVEEMEKLKEHGDPETKNRSLHLHVPASSYLLSWGPVVDADRDSPRSCGRGGDGGGDKYEHLALGDTPNIAARLQAIAEPNTIVISSTPYRLVQGYFTCQNLGFHTLKGASQPMEVYHVLQQSDVQNCLGVAVTKGLTPLVGREQEVGLLLERWEQAKEGLGQVVLL